MGIPNRAAPIDIEPLKDGSEAQHAGGQQQLVEAIASGLRSALTEILSSREALEEEVEVDEVDNQGEVTVWIPGSTNHELVASLTFALQVHKSVSGHRQTPYTVQYDLKPQIRSGFQEEPGNLLASGSKNLVPGSNNLVPGSTDLAPGSLALALRSKNLAPGSKIHAPGSKKLLTGSKVLLPGSKIHAPGSKNLATGSTGSALR